MAFNFGIENPQYEKAPLAVGGCRWREET